MILCCPLFHLCCILEVMDTILSSPLLIYLLVINLLAFSLFWFDKWMAQIHSWRIPEMVLWVVSLLGGSIGAWVAMIVFHHKTKKLSFQLVMALILLVQGGGMAWLYLTSIGHIILANLSAA